MLYPDYEELLIVVNGVTKLSIGFSNPIGWDETGVRFAFINNDLGHHQDVSYCRYDKFINYQYLQFAETGESVQYTNNMLKISNFPTKEKITTQFKINGTSIIKNEWVSFGKHYDRENSFEVIQSYATTDKPITKEILNYFMELNQGFPIGFMKASYGTFLTSLNTIKIYDEFLQDISNLYDIKPIRNGFAVSMCGVEYGGVAYVHSPDPTMKYKLIGDWENAYICRYFSSLLLSELESYSLNCAGITSTSPVNFIFSNILNKNFTVSLLDDYLVIQIDEHPEYQLRLNLSNGLMYDLSIMNDFLYKGAISNSPYNYCFHDGLTNKIIFNLTKNNDKNLNDKSIKIDKDLQLFLEDVLSDFSLASAAVMIPAILVFIGTLPITALAIPIVIVTLLIIGGVGLKWHANGGNLNNAIGDSITSIILNWV